LKDSFGSMGAFMSCAKRKAGVALAKEHLAGLDAPVEVRRHPAARRMTLRVSRTRRAVIVTLPEQCDLGEAGQFIDRNIEWVRERLVSLPQPVALADGALLPLRGEPHVLKFAAGEAGGVTRRPECGGATLVIGGPPARAPRRLKEWLIGEARRDLDAAVLRHARKLSLRPKRIAVRDQASRWGSCSTTGLLSFSWRLILAPPLVLDYVAAHEVAHLAEMNHGPRFWALVRTSMPRLEEAKLWLARHGMELHRYDVAA
jgi:hypothetical protein